VDRQNANFESLAKDAAAHCEAGRWADADAVYRAALAAAPGHPGILHNLGVLAARKGDHATAIEWFDAAIAAEPCYASAHYNRGAAFDALRQPRAAIADFVKATSLEPAHYPSHRALGFLYLAEGDRGRALDHFARTYDLRRGTDRNGIAAKSLEYANRTKLSHDGEQFRYLARRHRDGTLFDAMAGDYEAVGTSFPAAVAKLSRSDLARLGETYNTAVSIRDAAEVSEGALALRRDREQIVRAFERGSGVVSFDDLLTPRAFAGLKRYLLESTIWHDFNHIGGFVASYLEDGLACPLLLQIADELRALFPEVLRDHPLSQAWSFKAVSPKAGVDVHADDAAVSLNFWMTPTAANLKPGAGGMRVCLVPPPPDWPLTGYDQDRGRSVIFLEQNPGQCVVAPYRENRAVLFRSRLLHFSDQPEFAEGYENHRINVSLLFGCRSSA
jgi:tetratricopeptide (TPR) repeat protein